VSEQQGPEPGEPVVVKKYANRRLYDTSSSAYVTLDDLSEMVKRGTDFVVFDAKTNEEITRQVLTQIIVEEENRGENLLPIQFLRQLIRLYGGSAGGPAMLPSYLEMSLDTFVRQQERLREAFAGGLGRTPTAHAFEDQVRQNMQMFERAMQMFSPLAYARPETTPPPAEETPPAPADDLSELKQRVEEMSRQLERLAAKPGQPSVQRSGPKVKR
jgi:polyhydroxyalkanoate synthesis repressor PhaR